MTKLRALSHYLFGFWLLAQHFRLCPARSICLIYSLHYFEAPFDARTRADVFRRKSCGRSSQRRSPCALLTSPELTLSLLPRCQQFVAFAARRRSARYIPTRYPPALFMWTPHALMPRKRQCMYLIYVENIRDLRREICICTS